MLKVHCLLLNAASTNTQSPMLPTPQPQPKQQTDREDGPEKQPRITLGVRRRKTRKKDAEQKETAASENKDHPEEKKRPKKKLDLPEINRSVCEKCGKRTFQASGVESIQEEMHKDVVPSRTLKNLL
ncbi:hypothetical protein CEXT_81561, partial [Caerostris extrusa]